MDCGICKKFGCDRSKTVGGSLAAHAHAALTRTVRLCECVCVCVLQVPRTRRTTTPAMPLHNSHASSEQDWFGVKVLMEIRKK